MTRFNWLSLFVSALLCAEGASADPRVCYELTRIDAEPIGAVPPFVTDLNDKGVVVGLTNASSVEGRHAFMWRDADYTDLHALIDPTAIYSEAVGINDRSHIIGHYVDAEGTFRNFLLRRDQVIQVDAVTDSGNSSVEAINNRSQIAGMTFDFGQAQGYIWDRGEVMLLPPLDDYVFEVRDINARGVVVGTGNLESFRLRAVIWEDGQVVDLGVLPSFLDSRGIALNDRGQVVGQLIGSESGQGFLWEDGIMTLLPMLAGGQFSGPASINNAGEIVGGTESTAGSVATFWTDELVPIDLNTLICADDPLRTLVTLEFARRINNRGQIVATGRDAQLPNQVIAFLLTPTH